MLAVDIRLLSLTVSFCVLLTCSWSQQLKKVLIFGGNGLMGAPTTEKIIETGEYSVTLVSRGTWYWDTGTTIKPHVTHISCDRFQSLEKCTEFTQTINWSEDGPTYFDAVVDFSAYHPFQLTDAIGQLRGRVGVYVYISSDSVYEVSNKTHDGYSREDDDVRPDDKDVYRQWAEADDYGHRKLLCEEELATQRRDDGIPYIVLRLPDVIGPRDNTQRLWIYQTWIRLADYLQRQLSVPDFLERQPVSLVYSEDVADLIVRLLQPNDEWLDHAYNLGFDETTNIREILTEMKRELGRDDLHIITDRGHDPLYLIPSVKKGPVNITKAKQMLGWQPPLTWRQVLTKIVKFNEEAIKSDNFESERREIVRTMQRYFTKEPFRVTQGIRNVYGVDLRLHDNRDEL